MLTAPPCLTTHHAPHLAHLQGAAGAAGAAAAAAVSGQTDAGCQEVPFDAQSQPVSCLCIGLCLRARCAGASLRWHAGGEPSRPAHVPPPQAKSGAAAQLVAAQAAALAGTKRARGDAEVDLTERNVEVAPGVFKRRVLNPHSTAADGTALAENISQVGRAGVLAGARDACQRVAWQAAVSK